VVKLYDAATGQFLGTLTDAQFDFMVEQLEEESLEDRDYYINRETVDMFEANSAEPALVDLLRRGLGERDEMDVRWERA
jgi:hypothetical protein